MYIPLQTLTSLTYDNPLVFWIAPIAGVIAVVASLILMQRIGKMSPGGPKAVEVGNAIREGAYAFLKRQYKTIAIITVVIFALLWVALPTGPFGISMDLPAAETACEVLPSNPPAPVPRGLICLGCWVTLSAILLGRLALQFLLGLRLLMRAQPLQSEHLCRAMESARARMQVAQSTRIRGSERIKSPILWCWTRRPVLLTPMFLNPPWP